MQRLRWLLPGGPVRGIACRWGAGSGNVDGGVGAVVQQESVNPGAVAVAADDVTGCIDGVRASSGGGAGYVESAESAPGHQVAVTVADRVGVAAADHVGGVDAAGVGVCRARDIEGGVHAVAQQETVPVAVPDEVPDDVTGVVDAGPAGPAGPAGGQRVVEGRVAAVVQQEPVADAAGVEVGPDDVTGGVDLGGDGLGALSGHVERGVGAVTPQEAVQ